MIDLAALGPTALLPFILIGFAAQLVDGALGMALGVICNTLLVAVMGVPPATASARIHIVEMFTTGVSGISYLFHRHLAWPLLLCFRSYERYVGNVLVCQFRSSGFPC